MLAGFKNFILRGNVIDLAVGVMMGAAFSGVVNGLVDGLLTPLISAIFGQPDLSHVGNFKINGSKFNGGVALNSLVHFLIVATAVYFFIVLPINKFFRKEEESAVAVVNEVALLTEIRDLLKENKQ